MTNTPGTQQQQAGGSAAEVEGVPETFLPGFAPAGCTQSSFVIVWAVFCKLHCCLQLL